MAWSAVYVSEAAAGAFGEGEQARHAGLAALQDQAAAANRLHGVRGLLLCGSDFFVQWIEADQEAPVRALLARIAADPRHRQLQVLHAGPGPARLQAWSMALLARAAHDPRLRELLHELRAGWLPPAPAGEVPAAIVRRLVEPGPVPPSGRRVGLFGQNGVWPGALAAYLAQRWGEPLQRVRLLGSLGLEREALLEHIDHDDPAHGRLGVVHYPGDLLAAPWMQGGVAPLQVAALFLGGASLSSVQDWLALVLQQLAAANRDAQVLCFLGRTAARHADDVRRQLAQAGWPGARLSTVPMADSAAVWQAIAGELGPRPVPVAAVAAPAPAPMLPLAPAPAPAPPPAAAAPTVLHRLLAIDGVAAAGLLPPAPGQGGTFAARPDAAAQALRREFDAWAQEPPQLQPGDGSAPQLLLRWQDRLSLLQPCADSTDWLWIATEAGALNESWLRLQVAHALQPPQA